MGYKYIRAGPARPAEDGLADNNVFWIVEHRSGDLWFATREGITRKSGDSWTTYMDYFWVYRILEDKDGNLWFASPGGGLSRYDGERWLTYTVADGLPCRGVYLMVEESDGTLWFWTATEDDCFGVVLHVTDRVPPGVVSADHGWWFPESKEDELGWDTSNVDLLTQNDFESCDSAMGSTNLRVLLCDVEKVEP